MEEGVQKGRTEGRYNQKIEIDKNLLGIFIPIDQIKNATVLSEEEIENLR